MENLKGNKGEWSEIYVFLKLLAEGKLHSADDDLNRLSNVYYPIVAILHRELGDKLMYEPSREGSTNIKVLDGQSRKELLTIPTATVAKSAKDLLQRIDMTDQGTLSFIDIEPLLKKLKIDKIKSPSAKKEDITLIIHDIHTGIDPQVSFSIKSRLGGASTLFNASRSSNFTYALNYPADRIKEPDSIYSESDERIKELLKKLESAGVTLNFTTVENKVFDSNLRMVDSLMPQILAELLILYYSGKAASVSELTKLLTKKNPLGFNNSEHLYKHKITNFLLASALGMTAASLWEGDYLATGGYIVVKENGDVVCYHIYNLDLFKKYLFNNTRFETPSTSRHDFGKIYTENGMKKLKLNLQVRFTK